MKVLTYMQGGHKAVGILKKNGQEVVPVNYLGCGLVNMTEFIASMTEEKMRKLEKNAELMDGIPMEEVRLLSPIAITRPSVRETSISFSYPKKNIILSASGGTSYIHSLPFL